jgi:uncharacterized protein YukE
MSDYIQYDVDCLNSNMNAISEKRDNIQIKMQAITDAVNALKTDWNTNEAQKVYDMIDDDWTTGVNSILATLQDLHDTIEKAKGDYDLIQEEIGNKLNF